MIREVASVVAAVSLTLYQVPQIVRIVKRRSSQDFSLPAYSLVLTGLSAYVVATWATPAVWAALTSLVNVAVLIAVILWYRRLDPPSADRLDDGGVRPGGKKCCKQAAKRAGKDRAGCRDGDKAGPCCNSTE